MTIEQAPRSSTRVRARLLRVMNDAEVDSVLDRMEVYTRVCGNDRAVTTVTRPSMNWPGSQRDEFDKRIVRALSELPGFTGSVAITVGRVYQIEWDGVRAPV